MDKYKKKYNDALERAKMSYHSGAYDKDTLEMLEIIFPELAESEDERIKEDLIQWINEFPDTIWRGHYKKDVIAWLEKQGEQKHAPQNTWKPSDEQMKLLKDLVEDNNQRHFYTILRSLYDQLKRLKGE